MKFLPLFLIAAILVSCGSNQNSLDALAKLDSLSKAMTVTKYTSPDGSFKISFPGTPIDTSQNVQTDIGMIEMESYTYEKSATEAYMVALSDYPSEIVAASSPDSLLQGAKDGALSSQGATLEFEEKVTLDGNPGYFFKAKKDSFYMCYKIFLKGNRLYQILMLRDGSYPSQEDINGFIGSFEFSK